jgi:hypothetical protein
VLTVLYTNTDKIRSALGLDDKDISDKQLTDRDLDKELRLDLTSWLPTHATLYTTGTSTEATDTQQLIADALVLYSTYYCSLLSARAMRLAAMQSHSDGKNTLERFATVDWQKIEMDLRERAAFYRDQLLALAAQSVTQVEIKFFEGVGLAVDPVTAAQ